MKLEMPADLPKLPPAPEGMIWKYRGKGWASEKPVIYCFCDNKFLRWVQSGEHTMTGGVEDYNYCEAVSIKSSKELDIQSLKNEIFLAIKSGEGMNARKIVGDSTSELLRHREAEEWANSIAAKIPAICKRAASKGHNGAFVVANTLSGERDRVGIFNSIKTNRTADFVSPENWNTEKEGLKFYYLHHVLLDLGLKVNIKYNWEGGGMYSWHEFIISW